MSDFLSDGGDFNLAHHLFQPDASDPGAGAFMPLPTDGRPLTGLEEVALGKMTEFSDRVEHVAPHAPEFPTRYRLTVVAGRMGALTNIEVFDDEGAYGGMRIGGDVVKLHTGVDQATLYSRANGTVVGESWMPHDTFSVAPQPGRLRRMFPIFQVPYRKTVAGEVAAVIRRSRPTGMLRDIVERQIAREVGGLHFGNESSAE